MCALKIKLCGFKEKETIDFACSLGINFLGFVFYNESPRDVDISIISNITKDIPNGVKKVAVVVDASDELLSDIVTKLKPDFIQLHGDESLKRAKEIKEKFAVPLIKAFRIEESSDLENIGEFEDVADYFLFDAKSHGLKGGSGKIFDWNILNNLETDKDWFLSGGINVENIQEALIKTNAKMIDVSSALEEERGIKSKKSIKEFVQQLLNITN